MSTPTDEPFWEAAKTWFLELLYQDLAEVKGRKLTPTETVHLRGLLLGLSPQEMAEILHCSPEGLRVDLSRRLYSYIRILCAVQDIDHSLIARVLAPRYKRLGQPPVVVTGTAELQPEPGGQLALTSPYYIERQPIEQRCYETIRRSDALIRIKAPRQMGKTSLMTRILDQAKHQGCRTVSLSFQGFDDTDFADLKTFLCRFCAYVTRELHLSHRISDLWDDDWGSKVNCRDYFERYLLTAESPLVLALDEVDLLFAYPQLALEFLRMLRTWIEKGRNCPIWQKLRLIFVHSSEVPLQLSPHESPFNLGLQVWLEDFHPAQVWWLVERYQLHWTAAQIDPLIALVGGHPFLLQMALYRISRQDLTFAELQQTAATDAGIFQEHLRRYLSFLHQDADLWVAMKLVVQSDRPIQLATTIKYRLLSLGLVRLVKDQVTVRCGLYRHYFRDRL